MTGKRINGWQGVRDEVLRRIQTGQWKPGELIPGELQLAHELGCARTTVNRALQDVSDRGLVHRRRKAGTHVARHPVRKAVLNIPVIRIEIEASGQKHGYRLIDRSLAVPPAAAAARLGAKKRARALHVSALHLADGEAYVLEDRWINTSAVPAAASADFSRLSANEWLVENAPFSGGDIAFSAANASAAEAEILGGAPASALFVVERSTWNDKTGITAARLVFAPGYKMLTVI